MPSIGEIMAGIDARKRAAGIELRELVNDPVATLKRLGGNVLEDFRGQSRAMLDASANTRSAIPQLRDEAQQRLFDAMLGMGALGGVMTYHGTPHKFSKFDPEKAGKSGGTSFGLGHNLSADRSHAAAYGPVSEVDLADEAVPKFLSWESAAPKELTSALPAVNMSKPIPFGGGATIEKAQNGWLLKTGNTAFPLRDAEVNRMFGEANTGEQVYRKLVAALGAEEAASAWLRDKGIPGLVNNTERGVKNYTVFPGNEHLLKVRE